MTREQAATKFKIGARVQRGPEWVYGDQGGGTTGEVTEIYPLGYFLVFVLWDNGAGFPYLSQDTDYEDLTLASWEQGDI